MFGSLTPNRFKLAALVTVLMVALSAGVGVAKADSEVGTGYPRATANDAELECSNGSFAIGFPIDASPRMSIFAYSFDGTNWSYTPWFYFSSSDTWEWQGSAWSYDVWNGLSVAAGGTVYAYEYRYDSGQWVDLGSCEIWSYYGGYDFSYQNIYP